MKKITVARSWNELNDFQLQEIANLYLNTPPEEFEKAYFQMILILFRKGKGFFAGLKFRWIINQLPISALEPFAKFLLEKTDYYKFPKIKGLIEPVERLQNITVKQFSTIDLFFHQYETQKTEISLKRFVATLYRLQENFDELDLPTVARFTDKLSLKQMQIIALAYKFTRLYIYNRFPVVFPKPKPNEEEKIKPTFQSKQPNYVSFDKIIIGLSMDELQPLGKKQDINQVRIYEFLGVLSESILYHKEKAAKQ